MVHDEHTEKKRQSHYIKQGQIRKIMDKMTPVSESAFTTQAKYHKTQKNLSFKNADYDTYDVTEEAEFGRKLKTGIVENRGYNRIDEGNTNYDDKVVDTQTKIYKDKSKQNRRVHPDAIAISVDPYCDIGTKKKLPNLYDHNSATVVREYTMQQRLNN
jgi:hypothetical protein